MSGTSREPGALERVNAFKELLSRSCLQELRRILFDCRRRGSAERSNM